jgi:hypothetical protein
MATREANAGKAVGGVSLEPHLQTEGRSLGRNEMVTRPGLAGNVKKKNLQRKRTHELRKEKEISPWAHSIQWHCLES